MTTRKTALLSFTAFLFVLLALVGLMFFVFNQTTAPTTPASTDQAAQEQVAPAAETAAPVETPAAAPTQSPETTKAPAEPGLPKVTYENDE